MILYYYIIIYYAYLTVDQLDKPVAVIDIIGLTSCDATQLVTDT